MTALAPTLQAFFTDRLMDQRQASGHTIAAYRDTLRLLLCFAEARTGKAPSVLDVEDLDVDMVGAFLVHLRDDRHNGPRTRNARLSAVHALFRYAALRHPEHAATIQSVLAIPPARFEKADVAFLDPGEVDALLAAPDRSRWFGRRDHALWRSQSRRGCGSLSSLGSPATMCTSGPGRTFAVSARAASSARRHSRPSSWRCCEPGSTSAAARQATRSFRRAAAGVSAPTPLR